MDTVSVEALTALIERHGPLLFFGLGFAEFIGIPVASVPALFVGGALASAAAGAHPLLMIVAAASGGWAADALVFTATRWKGAFMVDAACGLTSNPRACVFEATKQVKRTGPIFIFWAKFVPGVSNLIAPAAALAGVDAPRFLVRNFAALLLWASVYTGVGWIFAPRVIPLVEWTTSSLGWVLPAIVMLVGFGMLWRVWRVRRHRRMHPEVTEPPPPPPEGDARAG